MRALLKRSKEPCVPGRRLGQTAVAALALAAGLIGLFAQDVPAFAQGSPSPAPSGSPNAKGSPSGLIPFAIETPDESVATASGKFSPKVIYVLGTGDASTRGRFIASLITRLQQYNLVNGAQQWLIPEPDWTLADFASACNSQYKTTFGAMVVGVAAVAAGGDDKFVVHHSTLQIAGSALFARCYPPNVLETPTPPTPKPTETPKAPPSARPYDVATWYDGKCLALTTAKDSVGRIVRNHLYARCLEPRTAEATPSPKPTGAPAFVWASPMETAYNRVTIPTLLPPAILLGSLVAAYETFVPSKTSSSESTIVFPVARPLPPSGTTKSIVDQSQSTSNPAALGGITTNLYGPALQYTTAAVAIPLDQQSWETVDGVVTQIVIFINCRRADAAAPLSLVDYPKSSGPPRAPICGRN